MGTNGYSSIQVVDNGGAAIVVPNQSVQLVLGTCSSGTVNQFIATRSPQTLNNTLGWGPLVEAAAMSCTTGGTVYACKVPTVTPGASTAVTKTGTGLSVMTVTGTPFDTYFVEVLVMVNGTFGTTGQIQVSLDAGRTFSPTISLGAAATYLIPGTGITLNFTAATGVAGDFYKFSTTEPLWNDAGILAAINAFAASPYAAQGVGSMHITGPCAGSDATAIGGYLESQATAIQPLFLDVILSAADAIAPVAWGGAGQTDAAWVTATLTSHSAVAQKRVSTVAAYWNVSSALINPLGFVPRFRRSLAYPIAARTVAPGFTANRSWGRVKGGGPAFGAVPYVVIDPVNDPTDGFVYHNEAINPGLNAGRFVCATTRSYAQGIYVLQANNMATTGAQILSRPLMAVANVASTILLQVGQQEINNDVRLLKTGVLDPRDVRSIQSGMQSAIDNNMTSQQMISSATVVLDGTHNVNADGQIPYSCTLVARGIVLQVNGTLQYSNSAQA